MGRFELSKVNLTLPVVFAAGRSGAVALVFFFFCVALWLIAAGLLHVSSVFSLVNLLFLSFKSLGSPHMGKRELVVLLFVFVMFMLHAFNCIYSSSWFHRWVAIFDCGTSWTSHYIFFFIEKVPQMRRQQFWTGVRIH